MKQQFFYLFMLLISAGAYSQNVGVGTAAPVSKLNVEGNGAATEVLRVSNDKNATKDSIMVMTSKGIVGIGTSPLLHLRYWS